MHRLYGVGAVLVLALISPQLVARATITFDPGLPTSPVNIYEPLSYEFRATATGDTTIDFSLVSGSLPTGTTLIPAGLLSGTPTALGSFDFTVRATGSPSGDFAEKAFTIVVKAPTITVTGEGIEAPWSIAIDQLYATRFSAEGGNPGGEYWYYTFRRVSGTVPPGMIFYSDGLLGGPPEKLGTYSFKIVARHKSGFQSAPQSVTVKVVTDPTAKIINVRLPNGKVGVPYQYELKDAHQICGDYPGAVVLPPPGGGGSGFYGNTPPGLDVNWETHGTPMTAGTYRFKIFTACGDPTRPITEHFMMTLKVTIVIVGRGPTLPVTGSNAMLTVSLGLGTLVLGILLYLVTRKRRIRAFHIGEPGKWN